MVKVFRIDELAKELGVNEHTVYNWIRYAVPERLRPQKRFNKEIGKKIYTFTKKDLFIFFHIKELKRQGLNYPEIQEALEGPKIQITKEPIQDKQVSENIEPINKVKHPIRKVAIVAYAAFPFIATVFVAKKLRRGKNCWR